LKNFEFKIEGFLDSFSLRRVTLPSPSALSEIFSCEKLNPAIIPPIVDNVIALVQPITAKIGLVCCVRFVRFRGVGRELYGIDWTTLKCPRLVNEIIEIGYINIIS